jgi:hypothetical protein
VDKTIEVQRVRAALEAFFQGLGNRDGVRICEVWHPEARLFLNNASLSTQSLSFLLGLPEALVFEIRDIPHVDVHSVIATARVDYRLTVGQHCGFFNLVKAGDRWFIASWVDHGAVRLP